MTEAQLHTAIAHYLDACLYPTVWWSTFPLGPGGGRLRGARLKGQGTRKGTPDILLIDNGHAYWMEVKTAKGRLQPDQLACHDALRLARCDVAVVRSLEEVEALLTQWGVPLRGQLVA